MGAPGTGQESYNLSNKITEAWILQDYYIKINNQEICDQDIVDFEAVYGGCEVRARVKFIDTKGILTGDKPDSGHLGVGGFVTIGWTTAEGCEWSGEFSISKINTINNDKNQKLVQLDLVDKETRNFEGTYKNKAHKDKEYSKIIQEHVEKNKTEKQREFKIVPPKEFKELKMNLQIPAHINFHSWIKKSGKKFGFKLIKDKFTSYFVHKEHLEFNNLKQTQFVYEYNTSQYSFNRIVQFNVEGFDMDAYLSSIPKTTSSIDPVTAQAKESKEKGTNTKTTKKKVEESKSEGKVAGQKVSKAVKAHKGSKQSKITGNDKQYFNVLNNAQKCSIWVPGKSSNMIGKKITVIFPKPTHYSTNGDDDMFTGIWEVYGVRDKVIGMYYMMELFLRRSNDEKSSNSKTSSSSNKSPTTKTTANKSFGQLNNYMILWR